MGIRFDGVALHTFAPFGAQACEFGSARVDDRNADVHIFVGENGTGKTRLLSLLMAACGNAKELADRNGGVGNAAVLANANGRLLLWATSSIAWILPERGRGSQYLEHYVNKAGDVGLPMTGQPNLVAFTGGAAMAFRGVAAIRDDKITPMAAVEWGAPTDFLRFGALPKEGAALSQALSNMKIRAGMFLAGNPKGGADRTVRMTAQLENTLSVITGRPFVFVVELEGNEARLKVDWGGLRMTLPQLPDGLRAVIGWLANCVAKLDTLLPKAEHPLETPVVLFLDEPETHLHPAWQRQILPALQLLLPRSQIFVATHSPFVVSSVNSGWVYVLKANEAGQVIIGGPRQCSKGDTYIDAVEDALGLKEWYDPETESMLTQFRALRDAARKSGSHDDRDTMIRFAQQIAKRSESLEAIIGRELAQFAANDKSAAAE